ncbi:hypothetical protein TSUD_247740 [Trifolium subterraneum]|uniref:Reverse transcriptase zinc-binding domain-containing protein n=1 Tax=Trifolium subterraneum TaxID=3900 RepID=A0A2Z6P200_TRISU|nr:hypothetical protein TSUD_247740 [Trifolium subterraneum]
MRWRLRSILRDQVSDRWVWHSDMSGSFSVNEAYEVIWNKLVLLKVVLSVCLETVDGLSKEQFSGLVVGGRVFRQRLGLYWFATVWSLWKANNLLCRGWYVELVGVFEEFDGTSYILVLYGFGAIFLRNLGDQLATKTRGVVLGAGRQ